MRAAAGVLLFALCGCGGGTTNPAPGQTALVVKVTYDDSNIDHWHITGVALSSGRSFGPFDASGNQVQSGETVGLIFDPDDAGTAMVCIEGREGTSPRASACGMFGVTANQVAHGTLDLHSTR